MPDTIRVSFSCNNCGTQIEWPDYATDSTRIVCENCGADGGTYRDLREKALRAARVRVEGIINGALKDFV